MAQKLELIWEGKDKEIKAEPRILLENPALSFSAEKDDENAPSLFGADGENDCRTFDNMLIHGDNLLALKALEKDFTGRVKCIYIDPPYNTGSAFEHYDDNFEHSIWLNLMRARLEILRRLLSDDGSIWISIDDDEQAYMKVLCDEIFGRRNFVASVVWQKRTSPDNRVKLGNAHDYILVYVKTSGAEKEFNLLPMNSDRSEEYKNLDNDPRGAWASVDMTGQTGHATTSQFYKITTPAGIEYYPPEGRCWALSQDTFQEMLNDNRIWFGKDGKSRPRQKRFINEMGGQSSWTWWTNREVGHNQEAKKENNVLFGASDAFATPKPERLIQRVLTLATNSGDLVLDSFLGSGTTAAVAQKMGRRWIGIEMGNHAYTHCKVRLDKVISGEDKGGITKDAGYTGGGSYRFYELAPSLIVKNEIGLDVINKAYSAEQLSAAVALHEGYTYSPDPGAFWKQSHAGQGSYLFVTTAFVAPQTISQIEDMMADGEYLLIACKAFDSACQGLSRRITVKKIPQMLLKLCEFGRDDYSLNIINPPVYEDEE